MHRYLSNTGQLRWRYALDEPAYELFNFSAFHPNLRIESHQAELSS